MPRRSGRAVALLSAVALSLTVAACGGGASSSSGDLAVGASGTGELAEGAPITVGVLTSLTGDSASSFTSVEPGVKARLAVINAAGGINGHKINYVMVDDASTPQGASAAVRKMRQEHFFAVIAVSSQFSATAAATKAAGLPVTGAAIDGGGSWLDPANNNLFSSVGYADPNLVATTLGKFFKSRGATKVAGVGGPVAASAGALIGAQKSARAAGLRIGYRNTSMVGATTDVGAAVRGIIASGDDGLYLSVAPPTGFAIVAGLKKAGVTMKAVLMAIGYGGDLLKSPEAVAAGQGIDFSTIPAPVELRSPATKAFAAAVAKFGGSKEPSSFGTYMGWMSADLFLHGLKATGPLVTQDAFINALHSTSWSAGGLEDITDFSDLSRSAIGTGPGNCVYVVKLVGKTFVPQTGSGPICGALIPRATTGWVAK
jgi:ABC-type branched-subunit amino acid transport system substrate-binding protein